MCSPYPFPHCGSPVGCGVLPGPLFPWGITVARPMAQRQRGNSAASPPHCPHAECPSTEPHTSLCRYK